MAKVITSDEASTGCKKVFFDEHKYIELCNRRELALYEFRKKGFPFEKRLELVQDITDEINEEVSSKPDSSGEVTGHKKTDDNNDDDEWHAVYDIVGANGYEGVPNRFEVNGKFKYFRILIQKRWMERCIEKDNGIYECIVPIENLKYLKK